MRALVKAGLCAIVLLFTTVGAISQNNSSQVVYSDTGGSMTLSGNTKAKSTPFGFWIWCAAEAASPSKGGYQNGNACQGNMYFYALQTKASPVVGFVTELSPGVYTMHVVEGTAAQFFSGTLHPSFSCMLTNTVPDATGPGNTVQVDCMFFGLGGGTGSSTDPGVLVNITGPSN